MQKAMSVPNVVGVAFVQLTSLAFLLLNKAVFCQLTTDIVFESLSLPFCSRAVLDRSDISDLRILNLNCCTNTHDLPGKLQVHSLK